MEIEARLIRLERSALRWRIVGTAALFLLGISVALLAGQQRAFERENSPPPGIPPVLMAGHLGASTIAAGVVRADRFELGGTDGKTFGSFTGDARDVTIRLGQDGASQLVLSAGNGHGVDVTLFGPKGGERIRLALDVDGTPSISLTTGTAPSLSNGTSPYPVTIAAGPLGQGFVTLRDRDGHVNVLGPQK